MAVTSREQLKQYALRALGAPALQINVADEQLEDRIDEAVDFFHMYHYEGIERFYLSHKITSSELTITGVNAADFAKNTIITGQTSGAMAEVCTNLVNNKIRVRNVSGTFTASELVNNGSFTATLTGTNFYTAGNTENKWISIPDYIYGVHRVIPFTQGSSSSDLFNIQYQLRLRDLYELTSLNIVYYNTVQEYITLLDQLLNGYPQFEFNRLSGKLYLPINWNNVAVDQYVLIECHRALDPTTNTKMWGEHWLKEYTIALFKRQWATNLKKFQNMQLPGGVTIDGASMYLESIQEIKDLEDDLRTKSAPLGFMVG